MRKALNVNGEEIQLECNAATPLVVKRIFGVDILTFIEQSGQYVSGDQIEILEKLTYVMTLQAKMPLRDVLKETAEPFLEWLAGFDLIEMTDMVLPEAMQLWTASQKTSSDPKNAAGPQ